MGHFLSHPVMSKGLNRHGNSLMRVGCAEMQGYRVNMEDAHTIALSLSSKHPQVSYFSVFDGHNGAGAAQFMAEQIHIRLSITNDPMDPETIRSVVHRADKEFMENRELRTHGATACFFLMKPIQDKQGYFNMVVANVRMTAEKKYKFSNTFKQMLDPSLLNRLPHQYIIVESIHFSLLTKIIDLYMTHSSVPHCVSLAVFCLLISFVSVLCFLLLRVFMF
jgi:hypothetical protein